MIVGQTGSGKSVTWKMLRKTLTRLHKERKGAGYQIVRVSKLKVPFLGSQIFILVWTIFFPRTTR